MAQVTDRNIGANPTGFDMRTEINNIIASLESDNSGASEPLNTVAYMKWLDTSNGTYYYLKERNHDNTAWVTLFRYTVATKIMEAVSNGVVLSQTNIASEIHASSSKTTPVNDDEIGLIDSASTFTLKKLTWANLKATLNTYFNTIYQSILVSGTTIKTINTINLLGSGNIDVSTPDATTTIKGKVELATNADVQAGTDTTRAVTPAGMKAGLNATGTAPIYACRAWVNFNGTGTVAIRASGNVSSITDNGVGDYTVNFTTAMQDVNYSAMYSVARTYATISANAGALFGAVLAGSVRMNTVTPSSGAVLDMEGVFVSLFR